MPDITLTLSSAALTRVKNAFVTAFNFAETALPGETEGQFTKRMVIRIVKEKVKAVEVSILTDAAHQSAESGFTDPDVT